MAPPQMKVRTPGEAVARIAYLSSDIIISVQPEIGTDSEFSSHLKRYAGRQDKSYVADTVPEIVSIRHNGDPLRAVFSHLQNRKLVSVTTTSSILVPSILHLQRLAHVPVVLHVSLFPPGFPDYSAITSIKNTGLIILQSESLQEVQDTALTAHALALRSGKGVLHFFDADSSTQDSHIAFENMNLVEAALDMDMVNAFHDTKIEGETVSVDDKRYLSVVEPFKAKPIDTHTSLEDSLDKFSLDIVPNTFSDHSNESFHEMSGSRKPRISSGNSTGPEIKRSVTSNDIYAFLMVIWKLVYDIVGREYSPFQFYGPSNAESAIFVSGANVRMLAKVLDSDKTKDVFLKAGIVTTRLYRPWLGSTMKATIPNSVRRIAVLEQIRRKTTKWGPFLLDIIATLKSGSGSSVETIVGHHLGYITPETARQALLGVFQNLRLPSPIQNLEVGSNSGPPSSQDAYQLRQPKIESAYMKVLHQVFGERLFIANPINTQHGEILSMIASSPEFGLGTLLARNEQRQHFIDEIRQASTSKEFATEVPNFWLTKWHPGSSEEVVEGIIARLETDGSSLSRNLLSKKKLFRKESHWLIGSDAWAYDLGNSGLKQVIASEEDINMLIIESTPYSDRVAADVEQRKKDIGLYAMNCGNVYVASVAIYSSYTQVLKAITEADRFYGPSIILAYLPYTEEDDSPLTALQETKKAVSQGYWPLYRWNPNNMGRNGAKFTLDSEYINQELKIFLAPENKLMLLMKRHPEISSTLSREHTRETQDLRVKNIEETNQKLPEGIFGLPLTILYSSDNKSAEILAKQFGSRGRNRGLKPVVMTTEDYPIEDLPDEENIVIFTSTGAQGELSESGHLFWNSIKQHTELDLSSVNYSVFALGDSQHWPRMEDRELYYESANDLDQILAKLCGKRLARIGLAVDQDSDGYQSGYLAWEPLIWRALGVDNVGGHLEETKSFKDEGIELPSNFLDEEIEESQ